MLLWLLRGCYVLSIIGLTIYGFTLFSGSSGETTTLSGIFVGLMILFIGGLVLFTDLYERNKQITTLSAIYFGLLLGLLLGWVLSLVIEGFLTGLIDKERENSVVLMSRIVSCLVCCYITTSTMLQTKDQFRFIIPYIEFAKEIRGPKPLILDTSAIIDGRISDLCDTKIIDSRLIVTRFVLQELQAIADSSDKLKRNRGRRGLDILKKLQNNPRIELQVEDGHIPDTKDGEKIRVDERLVLFAKSVGGRVITNDFNLNKIAQLQQVDVINLNEVANSLKTVALPGEIMQVKIVRPGDQAGQGVGYLDDGTMVVVEHGRSSIGLEVNVNVTSVLQTPAGRMIFGRVEAAKPPGSAPGTAEARALPEGS